jgi:hypothetical protein
MTTQDSDSEITGKVAASLTPPVVRAHAARGEQSSGFFDLDTLYAIHVEQVRPPPVRLPPPLPLPVARPVPRPAPVAVPVEVRPLATRRAPRPQPIGWFAVFVTWLATMTLATLVATQLPAHGRMHPRLLGTSTPASAPAPTVAPTPTLTPAATLTPTLPPTPSTPVLSVTDLPRVLPRAPPLTRRAVPRATTPTPPPETTPAPPPATEAAAPAPSPAKAPPAAAPASTASNSLDDLIRREVAAEQKRLHPHPAP